MRCSATRARRNRAAMRRSGLLAVVALGCACSRPAPEGPGAEIFTPVARELFAAAARRDTAAVRGMVVDTATYDRVLLLAERFPGLVADASGGLAPQNSPLLVTSDSSYVVFMPRGRHRARDLLAVRFRRAGATWRVQYVGFQEPRHR